MLPFVTLSCLLFFFGSNALAHDLWIEKSGKEWVVSFGHLGLGHVGEKTIQYNAENVKAVHCFDKTGKENKAKTTRTSPVRITGDCTTLFAIFSSGHWTKTPLGTKNSPKNQVESPLQSWLSVRSAKYLNSWSDAFTQPTNKGFELVPLSNPFSIKPGQKLRLLVVNQGKPVPGAAVSYGGKPAGKTSDDGSIEIWIEKDVHPFFAASWSEAIAKTDKAHELADEVKHATALGLGT